MTCNVCYILVIFLLFVGIVVLVLFVVIMVGVLLNRTGFGLFGFICFYLVWFYLWL